MIDCVIHGDSLNVLKTLADDSIDSLVTDPPAGISFMNKEFDHDKGGRDKWIAWLASIMQEAYRVLKPGAHGLVWALPRTSHWTATALEDAGFEIRDSIYHLYSKHDKLQSFMGTLNDEQKSAFEQLMEDDSMRLHIFGSGFPKSHDVSKAIDRHFNAEREVIGIREDIKGGPGTAIGSLQKAWLEHGGRKYEKGLSHDNNMAAYGGVPITAPATPLAQQWQGWGSATKPSAEVWWLIRKPLSESSIAKNVLEWGTGAINIDACRIEGHNYTQEQWEQKSLARTTGNTYGTHKPSVNPVPSGRWPANTLLSHTLLCTEKQCVEYCPVALLDQQSGMSKSRASGYDWQHSNNANPTHIAHNIKSGVHFADQGGASRYFKQFYPFIYAAKASRRERNQGCEALPAKERDVYQTMEGTQDHTPKHNDPQTNNHPTVKSISLMSYLIAMITPSDGIVLDPFAGSGSTLVAAIQNGYHYIGIEQSEEYVTIAKARIAYAESMRS